MLEKIIEFLSNPLYGLILATAIGIASNILTGKAFERTKRLWWGVSSDWLNYLYYRTQITRHVQLYGSLGYWKDK